MKHGKLVVGLAGVTLAVGSAGAALAATSAAVPKRVTVKAVQTLKVKPNRYIQDGLRWNRDVYRIKSGGTLTVLNNAASEGPHTLTVVRKQDLPRTAAQTVNCKICTKLGKAHGADPESNAPPKFQFLENGTGQTTAPNFDRAGDSALTGEGKKGEKVSFKVTAKKGKTLYALCIIHPWMQARIIVG